MGGQLLPRNGSSFSRSKDADLMSELCQRLADFHSLNGIGRQRGDARVGDDSNLHANCPRGDLVSFMPRKAIIPTEAI